MTRAQHFINTTAHALSKLNAPPNQCFASREWFEGPDQLPSVRLTSTSPQEITAFDRSWYRRDDLPPNSVMTT